jgi:hypothetical protein
MAIYSYEATVCMRAGPAPVSPVSLWSCCVLGVQVVRWDVKGNVDGGLSPSIWECPLATPREEIMISEDRAPALVRRASPHTVLHDVFPVVDPSCHTVPVDASAPPVSVSTVV